MRQAPEKLDPGDADGGEPATDGRVIGMHSEHTLEGWPGGYLLTDRRDFFSAYRALVTEAIQRGVRPVSVFAIRHGETAWSLSGQHTGTTDIPLTENGRRLAARLRPVLADKSFRGVFTSPLHRAQETCELAGLGDRAKIDPDLMEWDYGRYEGLTSQTIHEHAPHWSVFRDGAPAGETPEQVGARVDRVIARVCAMDGDVALFAHGHVLRVLAARWIGLPPGDGEHFLLDTGTLCVLGNYRDVPAIKIWNGPISAERPGDIVPS